MLTRAQSLPCILGAYKGQGRTLNGSRGGRHIWGYPQVWQQPAAGEKSESSSWKSFSPLLQTSFVIQANSRSCCAFLVRNFGETIGKNEETGNSRDSHWTCQKTQSTVQAIRHLYSGEWSQEECKLTLLMEPCLDKTRRGSQGQLACSLSRLIAVEVTMSRLSPRVKLLQTTIYLSDSGLFFFLTSCLITKETSHQIIFLCSILLDETSP